MHGLKLLSVAFLSAALLSAGAAEAMDIIQYDLMTAQDQHAFLDSLSKDAETVLNQEGRSDDATKVFHLFNDISPGSVLPLGEAEMEMNLDDARVRDAQKQIQHHNAPRVQVEAALLATLFKNGVQITPAFAKSLMQLTGTFRPKSPPQQ